MNQTITLITGNLNKVRELSRLLNIELSNEKINLPEIQTTDVAEVAKVKAEAAYKIVKKPVLVDDTGLTIRAWGELPGALIRWFIDNVGNAGIVGMLGDNDRAAFAATALGYCDENGSRVFNGMVDGTIPEKPRGENGFGFDAIFIPKGSEKTFAEMTSDEKDSFSSRAIAAAKMRELLKN
ncbi:RdgB/HAM1 family non-canonical purine NTP pyrophosphatase [Candidatus Saccharibacteria bacterium]|nr:RdgB/HAM1 family non-canonical purine NTP pyrophosphatase [Candidatus Saccharibacteria bacterium]